MMFDKVLWTVVILAVIGWVMNVIKFVMAANSGEFDLIGVLHGVGIIVAPFGVVMGWFVW